MLLLIVIASLAIAQFAATRRVLFYQTDNQRLRAQNARLRVEAGYLEVTDRSKVAVLQLPELDEFTWRWKVYLPKGQWQLHYSVRGIPQSNTGTSGGSSSVEGGQELIISASIRKNAEGEWQLVVNRGGTATSRVSLGGDHQLVGPNNTGGFTFNNVGVGSVAVFEPNAFIELLRLRSTERVPLTGNSFTTKASPGPTDGIHIWLKRN